MAQQIPPAVTEARLLYESRELFPLATMLEDWKEGKRSCDVSTQYFVDVIQAFERMDRKGQRMRDYYILRNMDWQGNRNK